MIKKLSKVLMFLVLSVLIFSETNTFSASAAPKKRHTRRARRPFTLGDNVMPVHKAGIKLPGVFYRGIYLHSGTGYSLRAIKRLIPLAKKSNINAFVIDVAPYRSFSPRINAEAVKLCLDNGIYPIARVVAFQYGFKSAKILKWHLDAILKLVDLSVKAGFKEIQLDYIRFADGWRGLSLKKKYELIENLLKKVKEKINNPSILLATDVFGRIVYNRSDIIGQNLESMASVADVICPMVYPSHYFPDRYKLSRPYFTVRQSVIKGLNRVGSHTFIMPYIQAFRYNVGWARMSLGQYIIEQVKAVETTAARGYIIWNARNRYGLTFSVLTKYYKENPDKLSNNPSKYDPVSGRINVANINTASSQPSQNPTRANR
jgi:hypothetical protein